MTTVAACLCEGTAEEVIMKKLLEDNKLPFSKEELLGKDILRVRSGRNFATNYLNHTFSETIEVYRIHDSKSEVFNLPKPYEQKIKLIDIYTAPEIEMLMIFKEGWYDDWTKEKNHNIKPSEFCSERFPKDNIKSRKFNECYWDVDAIIASAKEYDQKTKKSGKSINDLIIANNL